MTTAAATRPDLRVGGNYTAEDNGDGTYNILDVCVFAEIPAGAKRNQEPIGRDWQEAAVLQNKARESSGHLPPVHIYHSDEVSVKPVYAGKLRLRGVKQVTYEGRRLWGTFGDILGIPADVFSKVKKGFLPYRSVEIHNWAKPEIDSLALMDTDVPFFRMPMLTIGKVVQRDADMFMDKGRPYALACRPDKKQGGLVLFRFSERGDMEGKKKTEEEDKAPDAGKDEGRGLNAPPAKTGGDDGEGPVKDGTVPETSNAVKGPVGGAEMEDEGAAPGAPGAPGQEAAAPKSVTVDLGPVMSMMQSIGTMMKQVLERLGPAPQTQEKIEPIPGLDLGKEAMGSDFKDETNETSMEESDMAEKDPKDQGKIVFASKDELKSFVGDTIKEAVLSATGPLTAKLSALEAKAAEGEKKTAVAARLADAKRELTENGQAVTPEIEKHLARSAEISEDFLKEQVAVFKSTLPKEPPRDGADFEDRLRGQGAGDTGEDEVNAFCAEHGPQHAGWAKKQMAAFRAFQATGSSDTTAEEWLATNFRAATMAQRNRV